MGSGNIVKLIEKQQLRIMDNYWDKVKHEYNKSEITTDLFETWVMNSDPVRMVQIYEHSLFNYTYIPKFVKINYNK